MKNILRPAFIMTACYCVLCTVVPSIVRVIPLSVYGTLFAPAIEENIKRLSGNRWLSGLLFALLEGGQRVESAYRLSGHNMDFTLLILTRYIGSALIMHIITGWLSGSKSKAGLYAGIIVHTLYNLVCFMA